MPNYRHAWACMPLWNAIWKVSSPRLLVTYEKCHRYGSKREAHILQCINIVLSPLYNLPLPPRVKSFMPKVILECVIDDIDGLLIYSCFIAQLHCWMILESRWWFDLISNYTPWNKKHPHSIAIRFNAQPVSNARVAHGRQSYRWLMMTMNASANLILNCRAVSNRIAGWLNIDDDMLLPIFSAASKCRAERGPRRALMFFDIHIYFSIASRGLLRRW